MTASGTDLPRGLDAIVGVASALRPAREEVNEAMIRHWCEAMSDRNPVYTDRQIAARSVHRGIVAPPAMLDAWMMPGLGPRSAQLSEAGQSVGLVPVLEILDAAGFTAIIATNTLHHYERYLRPGDRLSVRSVITAVSPQKQTAAGAGHFVTSLTELLDETGAPVGRIEFRVLKFRPADGAAPAPAELFGGNAPAVPVAAPPPPRATTLRFAEVRAGAAMQSLAVPITATQIVAGAIASRDFEPVHHDVEEARRRGSPDIFMNIMTTGGLTCRYATDWAGPEAVVRNMKIRLGIPNFPGDTMTFSGAVKSAVQRDGRGVVEVEVRGANRLGDHVSGSLELELPL